MNAATAWPFGLGTVAAAIVAVLWATSPQPNDDVTIPAPAYGPGTSLDFATYMDVVTGNAPPAPPAPTTWVDLMLPPQ